jgi:hypothetical protein
MLVYRFATMFTIPQPGVQAAEALALAAADAEVGIATVAVPAEVTAEATVPVAALVAMAAALEVEGAPETATDEQTQSSLLTQLLLPTAEKEEVGRAPSQGPLLVPVTLLVPATLPVPVVPLLQAPVLIPDPPTAAVLLGQLQE